MATPTLERELKGLARELRRRRQLRLLVRSLWLALLWPGLGLAIQLFHRQPPWPLVAIAAGITVMGGVIYGLTSNPRLAELAQTYDRHFGLQEQLASAWETAAIAPSSPIAERLVEQAMITVRQYSNRIRALPRLPWREVETLVAVMLMVVALAMAGGNNTLPNLQPLELPSLPTAAPPDSPTPTGQPPAPKSPTAAQDQAAAAALAQALQNNGATRAAGDALQQGDNGGAAQSLRGTAGQGDRLSQASRDRLSQDLQGAAQQLAAGQGERAAAINQSAQELAQNPQQGLQDLAAVVDSLDRGKVAAQGAGTAAGPKGGGPGGSLGSNAKSLGGEQRTGPSNPPPAGGKPLPLPTSATAGGPVTAATGAKGPTVQLQAGGTGQQGLAGGGGSNDPIPGQADPLRIPQEDRNAVENYFSPAP